MSDVQHIPECPGEPNCYCAHRKWNVEPHNVPALNVYGWPGSSTAYYNRSLLTCLAPDRSVYDRVLAMHDETIVDPAWLVLSPVRVENGWGLIDSFVAGEDTGNAVYRGTVDWLGMPYNYAIVTYS